MENTNKLPGAPALLSWAFSFYRQHLHTIIAIASIPITAGVLQVFISQNAPVLLILLVLLAAAVANYLAYVAFFEAVSEEGEPAGGVVGAFAKAYRLAVPFMWISILMSLAALGGFFLFIIPGILLAIWLSLSSYALFSENKRGTSALAASWHYAKGYWGALFWRYLFFGLIFFLVGLAVAFIVNGQILLTALRGGFSAGVRPEVSLWSQIITLLFNNLLAVPLGIIYSYGIFRALKNIKAAVSSEPDETKLKKAVAIYSVVGVVGLIALLVFGGFLIAALIERLSSPNAPSAFNIPISSMTASLPSLSFIRFFH